uniref:NADH dehydrogenase subunit 2 n=1 Tax=Mactra quadrangularis TaxID=120570 RepID=UPI001BEEC54A|nr:NADH dehydrogenase subunit 2 [Mactra quadrangularis]QUV72901.1 NADH dehydrogenase subunit 2 [Mactra quadrangularis]
MVFFILRSYTNLLFLFLTVFGILLAVGGESMFSIWMGMEVSFLGVLFLMSGDTEEEIESTMKYFIIQVISSHMFLLSVMSVAGGWWSLEVPYLMVISLLIKLGVFPFHFWVPSVISQLSYFSLLVLSVIQKLVPLWVFSNMELRDGFLWFVESLLIISAFVGAVGGLSVLHFRALLSYSSISHTCFMVVLSLQSFISCCIYLFVYFFLNLGLVLSLWTMKLFSVSDLQKISNPSSEMAAQTVSFYGLSLAGMPPFTGFFLKLYFLMVCWNDFPFLCVFFLGFSVISLYYYFFLFSATGVFSLFGGMSMSFKPLKWSWMFVVSVVSNILPGLLIFLFAGVGL